MWDDTIDTVSSVSAVLYLPFSLPRDAFAPVCLCHWQAGVYAWLFVLFLVYLLLAVYLDNVVPDANGVRKPIFFFLYPSFWTGKASSSTRSSRGSERLLGECTACTRDYLFAPGTNVQVNHTHGAPLAP